jgi:hypothetical protein
LSTGRRQHPHGAADASSQLSHWTSEGPSYEDARAVKGMGTRLRGLEGCLVLATTLALAACGGPAASSASGSPASTAAEGHHAQGGDPEGSAAIPAAGQPHATSEASQLGWCVKYIVAQGSAVATRRLRRSSSVVVAHGHLPGCHRCQRPGMDGPHGMGVLANRNVRGHRLAVLLEPASRPRPGAHSSACRARRVPGRHGPRMCAVARGAMAIPRPRHQGLLAVPRR